MKDKSLSWDFQIKSTFRERYNEPRFCIRFDHVSDGRTEAIDKIIESTLKGLLDYLNENIDGAFLPSEIEKIGYCRAAYVGDDYTKTKFIEKDVYRKTHKGMTIEDFLAKAEEKKGIYYYVCPLAPNATSTNDPFFVLHDLAERTGRLAAVSPKGTKENMVLTNGSLIHVVTVNSSVGGCNGSGLYNDSGIALSQFNESYYDLTKAIAANDGFIYSSRYDT